MTLATPRRWSVVDGPDADQARTTRSAAARKPGRLLASDGMGQTHSVHQPAQELGAALRGYRVGRGLSLRALAKQVGLSGHGTLVDYEHGRRIPPEHLVIACEQALGVPDGELQRLRRAALEARGDQAAARLVPVNGNDPAEAVARPAGRSAGKRRRVLLATAAGFVVIALLAVVLVVANLGGGGPAPAASQNPVRMGFENPGERWWILWGPQVAKVEVSDTVAYEGKHSFLVTVTGASSSKGYSAVGITHDLETLHPGMTVTMRIWDSNSDAGGIRFFAMDSKSTPAWARETPEGNNMPLPRNGQWSAVTWTVPEVDKVLGIGMQIYTETDAPLLVAVDAVNW